MFETQSVRAEIAPFKKRIISYPVHSQTSYGATVMKFCLSKAYFHVFNIKCSFKNKEGKADIRWLCAATTAQND